MHQYLAIVKRLIRTAGWDKRLTFLMLLSSAAYNLATLLPPLATAGIIRMITEENYLGIFPYALLCAAFYAIYFLFMRLNYYSYMKIAEFYHISVQRKIFKYVDAHPDLLKKFPRGRIMDTFSDDIRWVVDAMNSIIEALIRLVQLIIIFIIFIHYDFLVAALAILIDLAYLTLLNINAREEAKRYANARRAEDLAISSFNELIEKRLKSASRSTTLEREKLEKSYTPWLREYRKRRRAITNRYSAMPIVPYAGKIILYLLLAQFVLGGKMTLDLLILLISYFELTITCTDKLQVHLLDLVNYGVRISRIERLIRG